MKKCIMSGLIIAGLLSNPHLLWAHSEEATICVKTYDPVVIDGKLDDWVRKLESSNWAAMLDIKKGKTEMWMRAVPGYLNTITSKVEAGAIDNPKDFNAVFYTMWDEQNFYFAAVVNKKGEVVTQHEGENIWQDDCLEIWLDGRHEAVTHTMSHDDEYQIGISPKSKYRDKTIAWVWRNPNPAPVMAAIQCASALSETGYIVEAAIPFSALKGLKPKLYSSVGFNVSIVNKTENELWSHITWAGTLHSDPTQFGDLYFMDAPIVVFLKDLTAVEDKQ